MIQRETMDAFREFVEDDDAAVELYSALCNVVWVPDSYPHTDQRDYDESDTKGEHDQVLDFSWRGAARFVADARDQGETYLDFYCSGMEGEISGSVMSLMKSVGLKPLT